MGGWHSFAGVCCGCVTSNVHREDAVKKCDVSWRLERHVVCAQIHRKVGKKGNDTRKSKTNGKWEAEVLATRLGRCFQVGQGTQVMRLRGSLGQRG